MENLKAENLLADYLGTDTRNTTLIRDSGAIKIALNFLNLFGYLKKELEQWKDISLSDILEAISSFQSFNNLPLTNTLDEVTYKAMLYPRCGLADILQPEHSDYHENLAVLNFATENLKAWQKRGLVYTIRDYIPGFSKTEQDQIFLEAFRSWTRFGNLEVEPARMGQTPDIIIGTGYGSRDGFDGPMGVLAWAQLPNGSDRQLEVKFDLSEQWLRENQPNARGIILSIVARHEFGHVLGLPHSQRPAALMAPTYNPSVPVPQQDDDIPRFQARYGVRPTSPPSVPTVPPPSIPAPPVGPTVPTQPRTKTITLVVPEDSQIIIDGRVV
jgi:hypothetical protein